MKRYIIDKNWDITECNSDNELSFNSELLKDKIDKIRFRIRELDEWWDKNLKGLTEINTPKYYIINNNMDVIKIVLSSGREYVEKSIAENTTAKTFNLNPETERICDYSYIISKIDKIMELIK